MGGAPSRILEGLWLGGCDDVHEDYESFADTHGIGAVVSLGAATPRGARSEVLVIDDVDAEPHAIGREFERVVRFVHRHRVGGRGVYVCCHKGISRASAAVAAYLVACLGLTVRDALAHAIRRATSQPMQDTSA